MAVLKPQVLSTKEIYSGKIFDVRVDSIRDGAAEYAREIVVHRGSAVIVPVYEDGTVAMVRQYRHAARETLLEIPAGSLENNEDPLVCAHRELEEEVGVTAERMELLSEFYVSPGFLTEKMFLYLATGLTQTEQRLEIDEIIELERVGLKDALEMVRAGEIRDAKTIIGLTLAGARREQPSDVKN